MLNILLIVNIKNQYLLKILELTMCKALLSNAKRGTLNG
jgi:hypothetical protein